MSSRRGPFLSPCLDLRSGRREARVSSVISTCASVVKDSTLATRFTFDPTGGICGHRLFVGSGEPCPSLGGYVTGTGPRTGDHRRRVLVLAILPKGDRGKQSTSRTYDHSSPLHARLYPLRLDMIDLHHPSICQAGAPA